MSFARHEQLEDLEAVDLRLERRSPPTAAFLRAEIEQQARATLMANATTPTVMMSAADTIGRHPPPFSQWKSAAIATSIIEKTK
jgi:hypothetical protein